MPNRRAHEGFGKILRNKLGIRMDQGPITSIIQSVDKLIDSGLSEVKITKILDLLVNNERFRTTFLKDYKAAVKNI